MGLAITEVSIQESTNSTATRRLSCGVLLFNARRELLLCHVTGQGHWDLPKGGINDGETPLQAALRETREETGLRLDASALRELGRFRYRPKKDLHLFATLLPCIDIATLTCESQFCEQASGAKLPEMDGYAWVPLTDIAPYCTPRMATVLTESIDMPRLLEDLQGGAGWVC